MSGIDFAGMLYDPIYESDEAADAVITLSDTASTEITVRAIYMPTGAVATPGALNVQTVKNAASVRYAELVENGFTSDGDLEELRNAGFVMNGETWEIRTWILRAAPTGAQKGEVILTLKEPR